MISIETFGAITLKAPAISELSNLNESFSRFHSVDQSMNLIKNNDGLPQLKTVFGESIQ